MRAYSSSKVDLSNSRSHHLILCGARLHECYSALTRRIKAGKHQTSTQHFAGLHVQTVEEAFKHTFIINANDANAYPAANDTAPEAKMMYKQICSASFCPAKSILATLSRAQVHPL